MIQQSRGYQWDRCFVGATPSCHTHAPDIDVPAVLGEGEPVLLPRESWLTAAGSDRTRESQGLVCSRGAEVNSPQAGAKLRPRAVDDLAAIWSPGRVAVALVLERELAGSARRLERGRHWLDIELSNVRT